MSKTSDRCTCIKNNAGSDPTLNLFTAISRKLSENVHATIPKGTVGDFEFTVFQRNLKEVHERLWT